MRDDDRDGWGDSEVNGTNYDRGTDCDDGDASLNQNDADTDGFTTCDGDCDDGDDDQNPGAIDICGNSQDDNCDDRVDEYCDFDDASGTIAYTNPYGSSSCRYEIVDAPSASTGDCPDCDFHFIERDTRLQSGSSTICRLGFTTYIGINLDTYQMYLSTRYGTEDLWIVSDLYRWDTFSDRVEVSIRDEVYRYGWYEPHDIVASFSLYGSW